MRPTRDDFVQGDGGAAAADAVDGEDRPGDPVQVADVFATTCVSMPTSPGGVAHRDDFWHRQDGGVGLADPQGHERDELVGERGGQRAGCPLRAAITVMVPLDKAGRAKPNLLDTGTARRARRTLRARRLGTAGSAFVHAEMAQLWLLPDVLVRLARDGDGHRRSVGLPRRSRHANAEKDHASADLVGTVGRVPCGRWWACRRDQTRPPRW